MAKSHPTKSNAPRVRPRTPQQLARQELVFNASVLDSKTVRAIAAEMKISTDTVISDLRHESERRADEIAERREVEKARSAAVYEKAIVEGFRLASRADELVEFGGNGPHAGVATPYASLVRGLDTAVKARERIDKIYGIDAPTRVEHSVSSLIEALEIPED